MRRTGILTIALLAIGVAAWQAQAQRTTVPQAPNNGRFGEPGGIALRYQDYLYGVIDKIGKHSLVLNKTKFGTPQTITLDRKTRFIRNGKRSSASHLTIGELIYVDVKTEKKTGIMIAKKVVSGIDATGAP